MKILFFVVFLCATICKAQTRIDFDYSKSFNMETVWIDYNQNEESELDEFYPLSENFTCDLTMKYKDFGSAGSFLYLTLYVNDKKKGKKQSITANIEDAIILKSDSGYFVINKLKEKLFVIAFDENNKANLAIYNPAIFEQL